MTAELDPRAQLPDELEAIAREIPPYSSALAGARQLLGLLPPPLSPREVGGRAGQQLSQGSTTPYADAATSPMGSVGLGAVSPGAIGSAEIGDGAVTATAFASTIKPPVLVAANPGTGPLCVEGQLIYNTTDHRLYKWRNATWEAAVDGAADIKADSIAAGQIAAGAIGVSELAAGAVTAGKLAVGGLSNLITNPDFELDAVGTRQNQGTAQALTGWALSTWGGTTGAYVQVYGPETAVAASGVRYVSLYGGTGGEAQLLSDRFPVMPGQRVTVSAWCYEASRPLSISFWDKNGVWISTPTAATSTVTGSWARVVGAVAAPANAVAATVVLGTAAAAGTEWDAVTVTLGGAILDGSGVTILNGALSFQDTNGTEVINGQGFGDAWSDFIKTGVYNGCFRRTTGGVPDYWTKSADVPNGTVSWYVDAPAPGGMSARFVTTGTSGGLWLGVWQSSAVSCIGGHAYELSGHFGGIYIYAGASITWKARLRWYDRTGAWLTDTDQDVTVASTMTGHAFIRSGAAWAPNNARYVQPYIHALHNGPGNTDSYLYSVTLAHLGGYVDMFLPPGIIVAWSGATTAIPVGWVLCDGGNGTPDLRDRMIVGLSAGSPSSGGATSPTSTHSHGIGSTGASSTSISGDTAPGTGGPGVTSTQNAVNAADTSWTVAGSTHGHTVNAHNHTIAHTHGNPSTNADSGFKYYLLAYIMKI